MIRNILGRSRVRESRTLGSVGATPNGLATRPSPARFDVVSVTAHGRGRLVKVRLRRLPAATWLSGRRVTAPFPFSSITRSIAYGPPSWPTPTRFWSRREPARSTPQW